jgi:hypothetical protein
MWGDTKVITLGTGGFSLTTVASQIAKISYRRPETWSFLFAARLLEGNTVNPVNTDIFVDFILIAGIGRSSVELLNRESVLAGVAPGFCRMVFSWPGGGAGPIGRAKWAAAVNSPELDDTVVAPSTSRTLIDHICAEDIQCSARALIRLSGPSPSSARVEVSAYFAPRSHVRPDWFAADPDLPQFPGGEAGGT